MTVPVSDDLSAFLGESPTPHHAGALAVRDLSGAGNELLDPGEPWRLEPGGAYVVQGVQPWIAAVGLGTTPPWKAGFRLVVGHLDSPGLRLRIPDTQPAGGRLRVPLEAYGSPILHTWFDRPLKVAGAMYVDGRIELVDSHVAVGMIPSLAIHYDREVNEGFKVDRHTHLGLVLGSRTGADHSPDSSAAAVLPALFPDDVRARDADPAAFELHAVPVDGAVAFGDDLVASPRLDNLAACHAALRALAAAGRPDVNRVVILFNHEEIGSRTPEGADSAALSSLLRRVVAALGGGEDELARSLSRSFCISNDAAHGVHPSFPDRHSPGHATRVGDGPAIKQNANYRYTTTTRSSARFADLARRAGVRVQYFAHRPDQQAGSTVGPMTAAMLPVETVDVGIPLLGMHSAVELVSWKDQEAMIEVLRGFFQGA